MNEPRSDEDFVRQAKELFDDSVDRLDAATLSRLNRQRQAALEQHGRARLRAPRVFWMPVTALAAAAFVAMLVLRQPADVPAPFETSAAADFEILLEEDGLDILEDLEFYSWLELSDADTGNHVG